MWIHPDRAVTGFTARAADSITDAAAAGVGVGLSSEITDAITALASGPITLVSPTVVGGEVTVDSNWDSIAANGQALTFSDVGLLDLDACGLYLDGELIYSGTYTTTNDGTIKVDIPKEIATAKGRGVFALELGGRKGTVKTLLQKVKLRVQ